MHSVTIGESEKLTEIIFRTENGVRLLPFDDREIEFIRNVETHLYPWNWTRSFFELRTRVELRKEHATLKYTRANNQGVWMDMVE